jgi:hypothetical protein
MVIPVKDLRQPPMQQVMVRLPPHIIEKADILAHEWQAKNPDITVTDVYRTAILLFFGEHSTDSREPLSPDQS